jgi:FtsP/CotA-like multicopper oxidase with cupredoxin domain
LHGHDFYILGAGQQTWRDSDINTLNYNNPTRRDTAMLPSNGWLALAFQTDNPGAWVMVRAILSIPTKYSY